MKKSSLIQTFFLFVFYFIFVAITFNISALATPIKVPPLTGPVIDEVTLLRESIKNQLSQSLIHFQNESGIQLQVYIIKSLQENSIEDVAIKLFDEWKLGDEKTDKGLLFLVAPNEKRMRIEVGQGLEGEIPDVLAKRIISDVVKPYFAQGNFNSGVIHGVLAIQKSLGYSKDPLLDHDLNEKLNERGSSTKKPINLFFFFIIIGIWLILFITNPSLALFLLFSVLRGSSRGGGGSGGNPWSGRGGKTSGGGASGGW